MNDEYKKIECISKMDSEYLEAFGSIVDEYRNKLSDRIVMQNSAFTLHDFDHHCFDIYKIISEVLFDKNLVYLSDYGLSERELYILNLAVLFHDIGMSNSLDGTRENHSLNSAEFVERQYNDANSTLRRKGDLNPNEIKALKAIITAHSNIQGIPEEKNGLKSNKLHNYNAKLGVIRAKFLAGVLRLADELDVSVERIGTGELEQEIEQEKKVYDKLKNKPFRTDEDEKKLSQWKGFEKSLEFWYKLHLISAVEKKADDKKTILLMVDDEYVQRQLDDGRTEHEIVRQLVEIYDKINKELREAIELSFSEDSVDNFVPVKKIALVSELAEIKCEIDKTLNVRSLDPVDDPSKKKMKLLR